MQVTFSGEESARFARFALSALEAALELHVSVEGREPLTSRSVRLEGVVSGAVLDRYMRLLKVIEPDSGIEYWVGGSNSTRSIAARRVSFDLTQAEIDSLISWASAYDEYVPALGFFAQNYKQPAEMWQKLDNAPSPENRNIANLDFLIQLLAVQDRTIAREAALTIRSFADFITQRMALQSRVEDQLIHVFPNVDDLEARIALVEDLGYIGTSECVPLLATLLADEDQDDHVHWAAAIALGRLPDARVVGSLLAGLSSSTYTWTSAAILLGLTRHALDENQQQLEPVFCSYLLGESDDLLRRYACLGLSRFDRLSSVTLDALTALLGDYDVPMEVRGYAALALSSCLQNCDAVRHTRLGDLMDSIAVDSALDSPEPEAIWGLEFLAELAALLELNTTAASFHQELAQRFMDWRGPYYEALSLYERGEASVLQGDGDEALNHFQSALGRLTSLQTADRESRAAIEFRRDIVQARVSLQNIVREWLHAVGSDELIALAQSVKDLSRTYARYASPSKEALGPKRLSQRETNYIQSTRELLSVMNVIIQLDARLRTGSTDVHQLGAEIESVGESLDTLEASFRDHLARGPSELVQRAIDIVRGMSVILGEGNVPLKDQLRSLRSGITELRGAFRKATWPMPARACPIGGLGRGTLTILKEDIPGSGTSSDPYLFPTNTSPILNVIALIEEMAPGGATIGRVECAVSHHLFIQPVHAVEGPSRCTFVLPSSVLSPVASTQCKLILRFEARDCNQVGADLTVYVRGAP